MFSPFIDPLRSPDSSRISVMIFGAGVAPAVERTLASVVEQDPGADRVAVVVVDHGAGRGISERFDDWRWEEPAAPADDREVSGPGDGPVEAGRGEARATLVRCSFRVLPIEADATVEMAWAIALSQIGGEVLVCLRPGDQLLPGALTGLIAALDADPQAAIAVPGRVTVANGMAREIPPHQLLDCAVSGVGLRTHLVRQLGGLRELRWGELDLCLRMLHFGGAVHVDRVLCRLGAPAGDPAWRRAAWLELLGHWNAEQIRGLGQSAELDAVLAEAGGGQGQPRAPFVPRRARVVRLGRKRVREFFERKRVCVVGCASSLLQMRQADKIEDHDEVLRLNSFVVDEETVPCAGRRTDVVVLNNKESRSAELSEVEAMLRRHDYPLLLSKSLGWVLFRRMRAFPHRGRVRVGELPYGDAFEVFGEQTLSTGSLVVASVLRETGVKSVYATGFDFYTGRSSYYYNDYFVVDTRHDMRKEMAYWVEHLLPDPRLEVDPILADVLASQPDPSVLQGAGNGRLASLENAGLRTLDLRALRKDKIEVKCDRSAWCVALSREHSRLDVRLEAMGPELVLAVPAGASLRLGLPSPRTEVHVAGGPRPVIEGPTRLRRRGDSGVELAVEVSGCVPVVRLTDW